MATQTIAPADAALIDKLVQHYLDNRRLIKRFLDSLHAQIADAIVDPEPLSKLVHSVKYRMKDPTHLKDKLIRILLKKQTAGQAFDITEDNLLLRINDLGGYRILHLHTQQMANLHTALLEISWIRRNVNCLRNLLQMSGMRSPVPSLRGLESTLRLIHECTQVSTMLFSRAARQRLHARFRSEL
jgi:hypothetical protein